VIDSSHDRANPRASATPRRDAIRTIGAAGAALLGVVGLGAAAPAQGKNRKKGRNTKGKRDKIGLTSAVSDPFSLPANSGLTQRAFCPEGFVAISGGLQGDSEVTATCMMRESHPAPDGSAWIVNVFCTQDTNTALRVGVVCFSRSSFQLVT
jgi:hypothetical protein